MCKEGLFLINVFWSTRRFYCRKFASISWGKKMANSKKPSLMPTFDTYMSVLISMKHFFNFWHAWEAFTHLNPQSCLGTLLTLKLLF